MNINIRKTTSVVMLLLILTMSFGTLAFAEEGTEIKTTEATSNTFIDSKTTAEEKADDLTSNTDVLTSDIKLNTDNKVDNNTFGNPDEILPKVSIEDAENWVNSKVNQIINFAKSIIRPMSILFLIASGFMTLFGALSGSDALNKGIVGMVISAIAYMGVMYSEELLAFIEAWVKS